MNPSLNVTAGLAAAVLLVAAPSSAQTPAAPPNIAAPQPATPDPLGQTSSPVTITGCLERPKPQSVSDDGKTLRPSNVDPATAYVLRSEPADGAAEGQAVIYHLISTGPASPLYQHVGHRVQLTGTMRVATNKQPGSSNQGVSPSTPSGSTGMETMPTPDPMAGAQAGVPGVSQPILVESLKMLDGGCKG